MEWTGILDKDGYGIVRVSKKNKRAHRVSYEWFVGPITNSCVLHKCDNPKCIEPTHLFLGTNQDNINDKVSKRRVRSGCNHHKSNLSQQEIKEIRSIPKGVYTYKEIATQYNTSFSTIARIIRKESYLYE